MARSSRLSLAPRQSPDYTFLSLSLSPTFIAMARQPTKKVKAASSKKTSGNNKGMSAFSCLRDRADCHCVAVAAAAAKKTRESKKKATANNGVHIHSSLAVAWSLTGIQQTKPAHPTRLARPPMTTTHRPPRRRPTLPLANRLSSLEALAFKPFNRRPTQSPPLLKMRRTRPTLPLDALLA